MIKTEKNAVHMSGALEEVANEVLNTLIAFRTLLNDKEPGISDTMYDDVVAAGKFGDREKADAYLMGRMEELAAKLGESLTTILEKTKEAMNEADQS